jgi:hypothetical protein
MAPSTESPTVAPIVCQHCGSNAHCVKRVPDSLGKPVEFRMFQCPDCGERSYFNHGPESSDKEIQAIAERLFDQTN